MFYASYLTPPHLRPHTLPTPTRTQHTDVTSAHAFKRNSISVSGGEGGADVRVAGRISRLIPCASRRCRGILTRRTVSQSASLRRRMAWDEIQFCLCRSRRDASVPGPGPATTTPTTKDGFSLGAFGAPEHAARRPTSMWPRALFCIAHLAD